MANIENIQIGEEYVKTHAYGQPNNRVKIISKEDRTVGIEHVSDGASKGFQTHMNRIECERYLSGPVKSENPSDKTTPSSDYLFTLDNLHVGNLIEAWLYDDVWQKEPEVVTLEILEQLEGDPYTFNKDFRPIAITEETIGRGDFERVKATAYKATYEHSSIKFAYTFHYAESTKYLSYRGVMIPNVDYVHQMQNALSVYGQQLTLKEKG